MAVKEKSPHKKSFLPEGAVDWEVSGSRQLFP